MVILVVRREELLLACGADYGALGTTSASRSILLDFFKASPQKRLRLGDLVGLGWLGWRGWRSWRGVGLGLLMERRQVRIQLRREFI